MADMHMGTCFCGAIEIETAGAPLDMGYCHCESYRAWSGGLMKAYLLWRADDVRVVKGTELLGGFNKSGMSHRRYCTRCGSHVMVEHPGIGLTDVPAARLPSVVFKPTVHLHYAERAMPMKDGLPKLRDFPKQVGGTGEIIPE
jgi:hypothetical protein